MMMKVKKIIAAGLTSLAFATVAVPVVSVTTSDRAYAQSVQNVHAGALLFFTISKTSPTVGTWYTEANFPQQIKRTFKGWESTYRLENVTYRKTGAYWTTDAHYTIVN